MSTVAIITGESGSGKTTVLTEFINRCHMKNRVVRGILCPGTMKNGQRFNADIVNVATNERCLFSERTGVLDKQTNTRFIFHEQGFTLGKQALDHNQYRNGDVCVVDEIGPMELKGQGFSQFIPPLLAIPNSKHIWLVRPNLVSQVSHHWSLKKPCIIDIKDNQLQQKLFSFLISTTR